MAAKEKINTPVGDLEWVIISGKGKANMNGKLEYKVDVVLDGDAAEDLKAVIDKFWKDNKPRAIKKPKSLGYYAHKIPALDEDGNAIKDEDGDPTYEETGKTAFVFKTGTTYKDGGEKKIPVYNAKGAEVSLGKKQIGNGSRGRVQSTIDIYEVKTDGKLVNAGVSLYLNGVQIAKFVEYSGGVEFDGLDSEYGDFEGFDDGMSAINEDEGVSDTDASDKVKI